LELSAVRWYCVRSLYRAESEALEHLTEQGFTAHLPLLVDRDRRGVRREGPLFPRYLFVSFDVDRDRWRAVASTKGVERIMSSAPEEPLAVPVGRVEELIADGPLDLAGPDELPPVRRGARVMITSGVFAGREGVCRWSTKRRIEVLMRLMSGERVVRLQRAAVLEVLVEPVKR